MVEGAEQHLSVRSRTLLIVLRVAMPLIAVGTGFLPWLYAVAPSGGSHSAVLKTYSLYSLSPLSWVWLVASLLLAATALFGERLSMARARDRISLAYAAVSLGTALSAIVFVHVAGMVSSVLSAPNPVALGYGVFIFLVAALMWTIAAAFTAG